MKETSKEKFLRKKATINEDRLGFGCQIETLGRMICAIKSNMVLSISAEYGMGKTFFADCLEENLKKKAIRTIFIDLFENDYKQPLIVLMSKILAGYGDKNLEKERLLETFWKISKYLCVAGGSVLRQQTGIDAKELLSSLLQQKDSDAIYKFKEDLAELIGEEKLVILIDEIDRCKPNFALEVLETIKHFFSIEKNIIFILFVNPCYMENLSSKYLGYGVGNRGYIEKFIHKDIRIQYPIEHNPDIGKIIESPPYIMQNIAFFSKYKYFGLVSTYFANIMAQENPAPKEKQVERNEIIALMIDILEKVNINLSLREIIKIIKNIEMYMQTFFDKEYRFNNNIVYLFILYAVKIKKYDEYIKITKQGNISFLENMQAMIPDYGMPVASVKESLKVVLKMLSKVVLLLHKKETWSNENYNEIIYFVQDTIIKGDIAGGKSYQKKYDLGMLYLSDWFDKIDFI